ncbi:MAG: DUF3486 family protein [Cohaesibacteraceae bacterium]|nr:DUF3486 family protein [Cohaesibacteraceae bacterium]MBL4877054.1 DUF3486 family protein [Cohaesibacteraceae bacterium]
MGDNKGRGRLSALELLPTDAQPTVEWAAQELAKTDRTQQDILEELNMRLVVINPSIKPISPSSFNRYSLRRAVMTRRFAQTREIASAMNAQFDPKTADDVTIIAAEAIKTLIFELLGDAGEGGTTPLEAMRIASALKQATQAQYLSTDRRARAEKDINDKLSKAVDRVAKAKGIGRDTVNAIKASILGVSEAQ